MTPARYQLIVGGFLRHGPRFARVAKEVGIDTKTIRKAWEIGWPETDYGRAIRDVWRDLTADPEIQRVIPNTPRALVNDTTARRVEGGAPLLSVDLPAQANDNAREIEDPILKALEHVRTSSVTALSKEADMLTAARSNAVGLFVLSNHLLSGMQPLALAVSRKLRHMGDLDGDLETVNPLQTLKLLERLTKVVSMGADVADKLVTVQRRHAGAPTEITENRTKRTDPEANAESLQGLARSLTVLQRAGALPTEGTESNAPYDGEETGDP